jgi:hypothetical protein
MINPKFLFLFFSWQPKNKYKNKNRKQFIPHGWPTTLKHPKRLPGWSNKPRCICYGGQLSPTIRNDFSVNFWVPKNRFKKNAIPFLGEWLFLILGDSYSMGLIIQIIEWLFLILGNSYSMGLIIQIIEWLFRRNNHSFS